MAPFPIDPDAQKGPCAWKNYIYPGSSGMGSGCLHPELELTRKCVVCDAPAHYLCQKEFQRRFCHGRELSTPYCNECHPEHSHYNDYWYDDEPASDEDMQDLSLDVESSDDDELPLPTQHPTTQRYESTTPNVLKPLNSNSLRTVRKPLAKQAPLFSDDDDDEVIDPLAQGPQAAPDATAGPLPGPFDDQEQGLPDEAEPDVAQPREWYADVPQQPDISECSSLPAVRTTVQEWGRLCGAKLVQKKADKEGSTDYVKATFVCACKGRKHGLGSDYTIEPSRRRAGRIDYACPSIHAGFSY